MGVEGHRGGDKGVGDMGDRGQGHLAQAAHTALHHKVLRSEGIAQ